MLVDKCKNNVSCTLTIEDHEGKQYDMTAFSDVINVIFPQFAHEELDDQFLSLETEKISYDYRNVITEILIKHDSDGESIDEDELLSDKQ